MDNNSNIIEYIKKNYPKIIVSPFKFSSSKALGFIVSNNKLVIGFINADGSIGKLIDPIDLTEIKNQKIDDILEKIPIVEGFNKTDKDNLLYFFKTADDAVVSKKINEKVVKDLEESISEKSKYKLLYDSQNHEIIAIKNKYEGKIDSIKDEYIKNLETFNKNILSNFEEIKNGIKEYKKTIETYIEKDTLKTADLETIIKKITEERGIIEEKLKGLPEQQKVSEIKDELKSVQKDLLAQIENLKKEKEIVLQEKTDKEKVIQQLIKEKEEKIKEVPFKEVPFKEVPFKEVRKGDICDKYIDSKDDIYVFSKATPIRNNIIRTNKFFGDYETYFNIQK